MASWTTVRDRLERILVAVNSIGGKVTRAKRMIYCDDAGMRPVPQGEHLVTLWKRGRDGFEPTIMNVGSDRFLRLQMNWFPPNACN